MLFLNLKIYVKTIFLVYNTNYTSKIICEKRSLYFQMHLFKGEWMVVIELSKDFHKILKI
jgi:hypothetical protein